MCTAFLVYTKLQAINITKSRYTDERNEGNKYSDKKDIPKPKQLNVLYAGVEANVDSVKYAAQKYKDQQGINIIIDSFPQTAMREKLFVEISTQNSHYDIYLIDGAWAAAVAPYLLNLLPMINDSEITDQKILAVDDFIPMTLAQCVYDQDNPSYPPMEYQLPEYVWKGPLDFKKLAETDYELIGLPFHPNVLVLGYRKDYFDNPKLRSKFKDIYNRELTPPEDWDQFLEVAKFFTRSYNYDSPTEYGTTLMAKRHEALYYDWRILIRTFGVHEIDENMEPKFNSKEGIRVTTFYNDLIKKYMVVPPAAITSTWYEVANIFGSGQTAMAMNYHRMILDPAVEAKGGKVAFSPVPGQRLSDGTVRRAPHQSTYMLSINKYSKNHRWSYDFILNATSPEWQKEYAKFLFHSSRISYYQDPEVIKTRPEYWPTFFEGLKIGYSCPRIKDYIEYSEAIESEISSYLMGQKDVETALDNAAEKVKYIFIREQYYNKIKK